MKNFTFDQLTVISDTEKSANQFEFNNKFNLITGNDNSVGKSTLVKVILWAMGCEPSFDNAWKKLDFKTLIKISIDSKIIWIARGDKFIAKSEDGIHFDKFTNVTGTFSEWFAGLVGFDVLLPNRTEKTKLETPPPAYYFLPYYMDQLKSWARPWQAFENLGQYSNWEETVIKFHTGYLSSKYFELESQLAESKQKEKNTTAEIERIETTLEVVNDYLPSSNIAITHDQLESFAKEITADLSELKSSQELLFTSLSEQHAEKYHLNSQLKIAETAALALEDDYIFSVENIENDNLECPLCGTVHDNSLLSRSSILMDKENAESQVLAINKKIESLNKKIVKDAENLNAIKNKIDLINRKHTLQSSETKLSISELIDGLAADSVKNNVEASHNEKIVVVKKLQIHQKKLKKEQKSLIDEDEKKILNEEFVSNFANLEKALKIENVNSLDFKSPLDFRKITEGGGAAESTRRLLAYQLAVYMQIHKSGNEIPAPIIIDTPNQQDQAKFHYSSAIQLIMNSPPKNTQVFLCAMPSDAVNPFKDKAKVINLDKNKILRNDQYLLLSKQYPRLEQ